jgi:hypothetical protein
MNDEERQLVFTSSFIVSTSSFSSVALRVIAQPLVDLRVGGLAAEFVAETAAGILLLVARGIVERVAAGSIVRRIIYEK